MRVLLIPNRLKLASALMLLAIPLAAFEVMLVTRSPWWKPPLGSIRIWCLSVACICIPLLYWICQGRRWAFAATVGFGVLWCTLSVLVALRLGLPSLGFFTTFLALYWGLLCTWLHHEMSRSFFDPMLKWYQGSPSIIPGLTCELTAADSRSALRVSRLDLDGAYLVSEPGSIFRLRPAEEAEMIFSYRERQVRCRGQVISALGTGGPQGEDQAAGFQFRAMTADAQKELGDFVETLRGEGHVQ